MPINIDSALGIHAKALAVHGRRAEVLASNLANADTPNYKARDIDFKAALQQAQSGHVPLKATHAGHIQPAGTGLSSPLLYRVPQQPSLDGNTVDTHVEQAEFARNAVNYQASLTFLGGKLKTLLSAIRGE
ncbi:MAG: flagellar basal body rod protein FlgB [Gammaproteobacteria bacterium]